MMTGKQGSVPTRAAVLMEKGSAKDHRTTGQNFDFQFPQPRSHMRGKQGLVATEESITKNKSPAKYYRNSGQNFDFEFPQSRSPRPVNAGRFGGWSFVMWIIRYCLTVGIVAGILAVPIYFLRNNQITDSDLNNNFVDDIVTSKSARNLVLYLCSWLLITWLGACSADMLILAFPHLFRYFTGYFNPAYQRYWRVFRPLRLPVTLTGCLIASYISFQILIDYNPYLGINILGSDEADAVWDDILLAVLEQCIYWAVGYGLEKTLILFITVHYHYRTDHIKITHSKEMHETLCTLYEASTYLHPINSMHFVAEDKIIRGVYGSESDNHLRQDASAFLRKIGLRGHGIVQFLGQFKYNQSSHWLQANSPYSIVERCLTNPKSAAALAKRIWMSLVVQGNEAFSAEDIAEVLGPYRREEANNIFRIIDENESGDIRLDEMVWTVVEAGRIRHAIYQGMSDINHCINVFDWVALIILGFSMVFFILVSYVPQIQDLQKTASGLVIGFSFATGRTIHQFLSGCVFVFFEHPFDIGDRVNIYNLASTASVPVVVTRQSILYTVFRRVDDGTDLQITNQRLSLKRVENISRSGVNKQGLTIFVDFKTSFKDLMYLRNEMESFLAENQRDYQPTLGLNVVHIHDLSKLELAVNITHKSNWSNDRLRAIRSSKCICALLAAVRKIPISAPGGSNTGSGSEGNPMYTVQVTDAEAAEKRAADKKKKADDRIDAVKNYTPAGLAEEVEEEAWEKAAKKAQEMAIEEESRNLLTVVPTREVPRHDEAEAISTGVDSLIRHVTTGLRTNSASSPGEMFYQR